MMLRAWIPYEVGKVLSFNLKADWDNLLLQ